MLSIILLCWWDYSLLWVQLVLWQIRASEYESVFQKWWWMFGKFGCLFKCEATYFVEFWDLDMELYVKIFSCMFQTCAQKFWTYSSMPKYVATYCVNTMSCKHVAVSETFVGMFGTWDWIFQCAAAYFLNILWFTHMVAC